MVDHPLQAWRLEQEPYYAPQGDEMAEFEAAHALRLPVLLKGPTGCGKTRFVEHMAWRLGKPLITVACHDDLSASDLVGRWLLNAQGTRWHDGPLTQAARHGALCYLDEIVEARADTTVVLHPLTDARRILPLTACNELLHAHPDFQLVVSYNPGYQSMHKSLKPSTRQRFVGLEFAYPSAENEAIVVAHEGQVTDTLAHQLVAVAERTRRLKEHGLAEGASTRMLIHAAALTRQGLSARRACLQAITCPLSDDPDLVSALAAVVDASFAH
jgi:nitric oxide reductase NorQ protein